MAKSGINKVILVGNLGQDPEVKYLPNGDAVVNLSLATSESWNDKNTGEKRDKTEWHRIVAFRKLGEICGEYLKKGSKVYFEGKLQTRKWQAQDGSDRYTTEIVANDMQMLDSRNANAQQTHQAPAQGQAQQRPVQNMAQDMAQGMNPNPQARPAPDTGRGTPNPQARPAPATGQEVFDDDIPF